MAISPFPIKGFPSVSREELLYYVSQHLTVDKKILSAVDFVERNYEGHLRASGNPTTTEHLYPVTLSYVHYMWEVAEKDISTATLLGTGIDHSVDGVVAAILHDTLEDILGYTRTELSKRFGEDVQYRVTNVTNVDVYESNERLRRQKVNEILLGRIRALDFSSPRDWAVLILKLADIENAVQTLPLPHDPDKEERVITKMREGRLQMAYEHSEHFYNRISGELKQLGYRSLVDRVERKPVSLAAS